MSKQHIEVMDGLARVESRLRIIQHSLGHHVGIVHPGKEDDLAPSPETAEQLLHALWSLVTEVLWDVEKLRQTPADEEPGGEGPIGPLPPDLSDALGGRPADAV